MTTMKRRFRRCDVKSLASLGLLSEFYSCVYVDANRAKNIKNKPRINEDPRDAQMKLLQDEINRLKQELLDGEHPARGKPSKGSVSTRFMPALS